jgi:hypothetical protein
MRNTHSLARHSLAFAIALIAPVAASAQNGSVSSGTAGGAPRTAVDLKPGTASYKWRLERAGKVITMDMTRTVKEQNGAWLVTETTKIPEATITDEAILEKRTLVLRKRVVHEGPAFAAEVQFSGGRATGTITEKGQQRSLNMDMGGAIFADGADGAGAQDAIAALPLSNAYTTSFRNFDVETQQVKIAQLRVMGTDTVTVPAGTFNTWKVLITVESGNDDTAALWVDKVSRRVVKMATTLPEMNGATGTAELLK